MENEIIKAKANAVALIVNGITFEVLFNLNIIKPDVASRLSKSDTLIKPTMQLFLHAYYDACLYLARRIANSGSSFDGVDADVRHKQEYACLFHAARELEAAIGDGEEFSQALQDITSNDDQLTFFSAAFATLLTYKQ